MATSSYDDEEPLNRFQKNLQQLFGAGKDLIEKMKAPELRPFVKAESKETDLYMTHVEHHFTYLKNYLLEIVSGDDYSELRENIKAADLRTECPICPNKR